MSYKERSEFDSNILKNMNASGQEIHSSEGLDSTELIDDRINIIVNMNQFNSSLFLSSSSSQPNTPRYDNNSIEKNNNSSNNHNDLNYFTLNSNNLRFNESLNSMINQSDHDDDDDNDYNHLIKQFCQPLPSSSSIIDQNNTITTRATPKNNNSNDIITTNTNTTATSRVHRGQSQSAKERRRERNKVLARKTRIKKKAELETLRSELIILRGENERLKNVLKHNLPSTIGDNIVRECEIQLPEDVANAVQVLLSRSKSTDIEVFNENDNNNIDNNTTTTNNNNNNNDYFTTSIINNNIINNNYVTKTNFEVNYCIADAMIPERPIIYASEGFCDLCGYSIDYILGKNYDFLQGPATDQKEINKMRSKMELGHDCQVTLINYKSNGTPFWNRIKISPLFNYQSQIALFIVIQHEVPATEASNFLTLEKYSNMNNMMRNHTVNI